MELSNEIIIAVKECKFSLSAVDNCVGQCIVEMYRPIPGSDVWNETIWFDGTNGNFIEAVRERANEFDVEKEAKFSEWFNQRIKNIISDFLTLVKDAEWKKVELQKLATSLEALNLK